MSSTSRTISPNEIEPKRKRRRFTAVYKAEILARAAACTKPGEIGELLRKECLYSSHLTNWRAQAQAGTLEALGRKRGPQKKRTPEAERLARLERENERLRRKLDHAEKVIDVQKKLSEILGVPLDPPSESDTETD